MSVSTSEVCVFFFNDTATTEIYTSRHTLSLHDALPIFRGSARTPTERQRNGAPPPSPVASPRSARSSRGATTTTCSRRTPPRSEEHTSELQSLMRISYAVFCLKKNTQTIRYHQPITTPLPKQTPCVN